MRLLSRLALASICRAKRDHARPAPGRAALAAVAPHSRRRWSADLRPLQISCTRTVPPPLAIPQRWGDGLSSTPPPPPAESFWDLSALDIDGRQLKFGSLKGKVRQQVARPPPARPRPRGPPPVPPHRTSISAAIACRLCSWSTPRPSDPGSVTAISRYEPQRWRRAIPPSKTELLLLTHVPAACTSSPPTFRPRTSLSSRLSLVPRASR